MIKEATPACPAALLVGWFGQVVGFHLYGAPLGLVDFYIFGIGSFSFLLAMHVIFRQREEKSDRVGKRMIPRVYFFLTYARRRYTRQTKPTQ